MMFTRARNSQRKNLRSDVRRNMPLPEPRLLLLSEAAERIANHCGASIAEARASLERAFREHTLSPHNTRHKAVEDWATAVINWADNSITWRSPLGDGGYVDCTLTGASVDRVELYEWIEHGSSPAKRHAEPRSSNSPYVPKWMSLLEAIEHVQRIAGGERHEAWAALLVPLREGAIKSRRQGGGFLGGNGEIDPSQWYPGKAKILRDGSVEFAPHPLLPPPPPGRASP
jgi:hypothetical protein